MPIDIMPQVGREVAAALGPEYREEQDPRFSRVTIRKGDVPDFAIHLRLVAGESRIHITPGLAAAETDKSEFPYTHERVDCAITVSDRKTPTQIAGDIVRRFLPYYLPMLAKGIEERDRHDEYNRQRDRNLAMFAELLGGEVDGEQVKVRMGDTDARGYIRRFQVGNTTVQIELGSVPIEVARRLMVEWMK